MPGNKITYEISESFMALEDTPHMDWKCLQPETHPRRVVSFGPQGDCFPDGCIGTGGMNKPCIIPDGGRKSTVDRNRSPEAEGSGLMVPVPSH